MWVAWSPIANATAIVAILPPVSLLTLFANGDNRTNAESQKTGIETKYPVTARPISAFFFPVIFKIVSAIVSAAPLFSNRAPITVPIAITTPIPAIVPPSPSEYAPIISGIEWPDINPKKKALIVNAKNGWSLILIVNKTSSNIDNKIAKIVNVTFIKYLLFFI